MKRIGVLLSQFSDDDILKRLGEKYPEQKKDLSEYQKIINELRDLKPIESDRVIKCEKFGCHIIDEDESYAFGDVDWKEVLGSYAHYGDIDFICSFLWELTFYGFKEKDRVDFWDEIKNRVKGLD